MPPLTTARTAAFMPALSPPDVRTAIFILGLESAMVVKAKRTSFRSWRGERPNVLSARRVPIDASRFGSDFHRAAAVLRLAFWPYRRRRRCSILNGHKANHGTGLSLFPGDLSRCPLSTHERYACSGFVRAPSCQPAGHRSSARPPHPPSITLLSPRAFAWPSFLYRIY
jgi:hypothetical protein